MSKNVFETEGPQMTSQYGAYALRAGLARLCAHMRMQTPKRLGIHMHGTRKHAHTHQYVILIAFRQQKWFPERASMLRYMYVCLVLSLYFILTCFFVLIVLSSVFVFTV